LGVGTKHRVRHPGERITRGGNGCRKASPGMLKLGEGFRRKQKDLLLKKRGLFCTDKGPDFYIFKGGIYSMHGKLEEGRRKSKKGRGTIFLGMLLRD